jgi:predicted nucleic acid-binding protein
MKQLVDSGSLVAAIRSRDPNHWKCASYFRNHRESAWVIPAMAYFEYQAVQSRLKREGKEPYQELFLSKWEVYDISLNLLRKAAELELVDRFAKLSGSELICACISKIEQMPLVTCDSRFSDYAAEIEVINPLLCDE